MAEKYGLLIDYTWCTGCHSCEMACKDYKDLDLGVAYRKVYEVTSGETVRDANGCFTSTCTSYPLSLSCNHCDDPACVAGCPTGAMFKSDDGTVQHVDDCCVVCRNCMITCPYGAPQFDEDENMIVKCDACKALREDGRNPVCVDACPMRAIEFGDVDELRAKHGDAVSELPVLPSAATTQPNLLLHASPEAQRSDFNEVVL